MNTGNVCLDGSILHLLEVLWHCLPFLFNLVLLVADVLEAEFWEEDGLWRVICDDQTNIAHETLKSLPLFLVCGGGYKGAVDIQKILACKESRAFHVDNHQSSRIFTASSHSNSFLDSNSDIDSRNIIAENTTFVFEEASKCYVLVSARINQRLTCQQLEETTDGMVGALCRVFHKSWAQIAIIDILNIFGDCDFDPIIRTKEFVSSGKEISWDQAIRLLKWLKSASFWI